MSPSPGLRVMPGAHSALLVLLATLPCAAGEPRAEYADASELRAEPLPHLAETALLARYQHSTNDSPVDVSVFEGISSNRLLLGEALNYCLGLDGYVGGGEPGASYGATLYALGLGLRSKDADFVSACAGVGLDALEEALPFGFKIAPELRAGASLGPLRPLVYFQPSWQLGEDRRRVGVDYPFDDFEVGVWLRFGRQHHYWQELHAAGGLALGVSYTDRHGVRQLGVSLGFDFTGGV